jgi:hypothetical protein
MAEIMNKKIMININIKNIMNRFQKVLGYIKYMENIRRFYNEKLFIYRPYRLEKAGYKAWTSLKDAIKMMLVH